MGSLPAVVTARKVAIDKITVKSESAVTIHRTQQRDGKHITTLIAGSSKIVIRSDTRLRILKSKQLRSGAFLTTLGVSAANVVTSKTIDLLE